MEMKILHIVGDSKFGGGSVVILRLAQKAKELGWEVDVLTTDSTFQEILRKNNIGVVDLDVIWRSVRPIRDIIGIYKLYSFLKNSNYTIVHTHTSKAGFVGRLAAKLAGIPIIIHTVHGFAFHEKSNPLFLYIFSSLERLASHWCDKIVTVSNFHKEWALRLKICSKDKIVAIPNGINKERIIPTLSKEEVLRELRLSQDMFIILTVGRLAPQKGIEYLLRATPLIKFQIDKPFKILIVGEGPLRRRLENLAQKLDISENVLFLGFRSDIGNILNIADIVVLPSLREGLSIALLEAMAAGKVIITTSIGSNKEVIENGVSGILVPLKDSVILAKAILGVLNNKELALRLGENAQNRYMKYYTEEKMLQKYMGLYFELVKKKFRRKE